MRKGLIILGGQGVGKTRLAESIAARYKAKDVGRFGKFNHECSWSRKKLNIVEGVSKGTPILGVFRRPYAAEDESLKHHRFIFISNSLKEEDIPAEYHKFYNVITLK